MCKNLSLTVVALLRKYGPSAAQLKRQQRKKKELAPAKMEEEDFVNDTMLSLPEQEDSAEWAEKARLEAAEARAAAAGFDPRYLPEEEEPEYKAALAAAGKTAEKKKDDSGVMDIEAIGGVLHAQKLEAEAQKGKPPREVRQCHQS